jgi:manganese-dependent inorganic pyrophosphatase
VDDVKLRMAESRERGLLVLDDEGTLLGVVTKSNLLKVSKTSLILVDHNELSQSVDGADGVTIREVVDHHRLGNFHTTQPIRFICEPVGSTSTLVAEMYRKEGVPIAPDIAGLLLAGVLSDTVMLKSPTSTERDVVIITWLEEKSGLDHLIFGQEVFSATSSLKKKGINAVVNGDFKTFEAKGEMFGVGQVETIGFDEFFEEKERLTAELIKVKESKGLKLSALLVTDIVVGTSLLLTTAEKEVTRSLGYPLLEENVYELKGVLSRKKQVAPHLLGLFNSIY